MLYRFEIVEFWKKNEQKWKFDYDAILFLNRSFRKNVRFYVIYNILKNGDSIFWFNKNIEIFVSAYRVFFGNDDFFCVFKPFWKQILMENTYDDSFERIR